MPEPAISKGYPLHESKISHGDLKVNNITQSSRINLNHRFDSSPINQKNTTRQLPSIERRTHITSNVQKPGILTRLMNRIAMALNPDGKRAITQYNANLQEVSEKVDHLLLALQKTQDHTVDGISASHLITDINKDLNNLTNATYAPIDILNARIEASLKDMSDADLNALTEGLGLAKKSELNRSANGTQYLNTIDRQLTSEIESRLERNTKPLTDLIKSELTLASEKKDADINQAHAFYNRLCKAADTELTKNNLFVGSNVEKQKLRNSLIVSSFEAFLSNAEDSQKSAVETATFLSQLTTQELKVFDTEGVFRENTFTMQRIVAGLSAIFSEQHEESWIHSAQIMLMTGKTTPTDQLLTDFVALSKRQESLDMHNLLWDAGTTGISEKEMDSLKVEISQKLETDLNVDTLNQSQLSTLNSALETLKLPLSEAVKTRLSVSDGRNG